MAVRPRSVVALFAKTGVLLATVSCYCNDPGDPELDVAISSVHILPGSRVAVPQGKNFLMRARVKDVRGHGLPDQRAKTVVWTSGSGLSVSGSPNSTVTVTAIGSEGAEIELTATVDGVFTKDTITIVAARPAAAGADWIASDYAAPDPPSVAMVNGVVGSGGTVVNHTDTAIAFVGGAPLDAFECPDTPDCGRVIAFPPRHALQTAQLQWTSGCDVVKYVAFGAVDGCTTATPASGTLGPLGNPILVPVQVWKAAWGWNLRNHINGDIEYARNVFERPWSGIKLNVTFSGNVRRAHLVFEQGHCQGGDYDITSQLPGISSAEFRPRQITIIYAQDLSAPDGGPERGYTCPWNSSEGTIVLVSVAGRENSDLAHELGHAIGQWPLPSPYHPDNQAGFKDPSNVMWSEETDYSRSIRSYLTLGQLYQMSLSGDTFLQVSGLLPRTDKKCQDFWYNPGECPMLAKDPVR
jgi:hypothetical protein